jgi:hypothetical protein
LGKKNGGEKMRKEKSDRLVCGLKCLSEGIEHCGNPELRAKACQLVDGNCRFPRACITFYALEDLFHLNLVVDKDGVHVYDAKVGCVINHGHAYQGEKEVLNWQAVLGLRKF